MTALFMATFLILSGWGRMTPKMVQEVLLYLLRVWSLDYGRVIRGLGTGHSK